MSPTFSCPNPLELKFYDNRIEIWSARFIDGRGVIFELSQEMGLPLVAEIDESLLHLSKPQTYYLVIGINPLQRQPVGQPNKDQLLCPTFTKPEILVDYIPAEQLQNPNLQMCYMPLGKVNLGVDKMEEIKGFIPPCTSIKSHSGLYRHYHVWKNQLENMGRASISIMQKINEEANNKPLAKNIYKIGNIILEQSAVLESQKQIMLFQPPIHTVTIFKKLAHRLQQFISILSHKDKEELLDYMAEWSGRYIPADLQHRLNQVLHLEYNHHDISTTLHTINQFTEMLLLVLQRLQGLPYIGKRKEVIKEVVEKKSILQRVSLNLNL